MVRQTTTLTRSALLLDSEEAQEAQSGNSQIRPSMPMASITTSVLGAATTTPSIATRSLTNAPGSHRRARVRGKDWATIVRLDREARLRGDFDGWNIPSHDYSRAVSPDPDIDEEPDIEFIGEFNEQISNPDGLAAITTGSIPSPANNTSINAGRDADIEYIGTFPETSLPKTLYLSHQDLFKPIHPGKGTPVQANGGPTDFLIQLNGDDLELGFWERLTADTDVPHTTQQIRKVIVEEVDLGIDFITA